MPSKPIVKLGNKQLSTPSLPVENPSMPGDDFERLISDMVEAMKDNKGVGIAAPQIGCNKRVIMFGFENNDRYPNEEPIPFSLLINPTIKILSDELVDGWEGHFKENFWKVDLNINKSSISHYKHIGSAITTRHMFILANDISLSINNI